MLRGNNDQLTLFSKEMYYYSVHNNIVKNYIHVMKYMGSKRELLEIIEQIISKNTSSGGVVLDLFSGTCGVGMYLRDKFPTYSNDIQLYSSSISKGTIEIPPMTISCETIWRLIEKRYNENYNFLTKKMGKLLRKSNSFVQLKKWNNTLLKNYLIFQEEAPSPVSTLKTNAESHWLRVEYKKHQQQKKTFPYIQTTYLFSEMYFSLNQSISIDSLKYAIDGLDIKDKKLADLLKVALIHAFSYCSAGTGHFAQFRDLSTLSSVEDVFIYRKRSVLEYFFKKAEEIIQGSSLNIYSEASRSFNLDYLDLLGKKNLMSKVSLVYADPPYSFVHYSRFYHAVEDLCRYDYPEVEYKGRYRKDRHQSPFCIKSKAPAAFEEMLRAVRKYKIPILISYSNTGMITIEVLMKIAHDSGYTTKLVKVAHKHSTMGRLKDKSRDVTEALLLCS
ncbi:MAG: DNA adenine methylase [Microgenomates group bacterium]